jgi:hypothetical protein
MIGALLACFGAVFVGLVGWYFVWANFRTARNTGIIYVRGARYDRRDGEMQYRIAFVTNIFIAVVFATLGIGGLAVGVMILTGNL